MQNTDDVVVSATNFVSERYVHASKVSLFVIKYKVCMLGVTTCDQVERFGFLMIVAKSNPEQVFTTSHCNMQLDYELKMSIAR